MSGREGAASIPQEAKGKLQCGSSLRTSMSPELTLSCVASVTQRGQAQLSLGSLQEQGKLPKLSLSPK